MTRLPRLCVWIGSLISVGISAGCYTNQRIAISELARLDAVPGRALEAEIPGADCSGCSVQVNPTTPVVLTDRSGIAHRLTPFYFHLSPTQLVAPDYGVLLERTDVTDAAVRTLSVSRTVALAATVAAVALGGFFAIQATAGEASLGRSQ